MTQVGDDSISYTDWTLSIRRQCCRFFSSSRLAQLNATPATFAHRPSGGRKQMKMKIAKEEGEAIEAEEEAEKEAEEPRRAMSTNGQITGDLARAQVNYGALDAGLSQSDRLSALSASSSLLSQLLNSSLNQMIELDNGSSELSCTCCERSAPRDLAGCDHRARRPDSRDIQVRRVQLGRPDCAPASARPRRRPALAGPGGLLAQAANEQVQLAQHDSLLDETNSRVSPLSLSSSISTCPCNFKSCRICMLQVAAARQKLAERPQVQHSACDRKQQVAKRNRKPETISDNSSLSFGSSSSSCAVRVTNSSGADSSSPAPDSSSPAGKARMGLSWSLASANQPKAQKQSEEEPSAAEQLEWLLGGPCYAALKSQLGERPPLDEPLVLPVSTRLDGSLGPIFGLDPRSMRGRCELNFGLDDQDGRGSMVEATASLARVVSANEDSSCSSGPALRRRAPTPSTPTPRLRSSRSGANTAEPIYDVPSMSPRLQPERDSSLTPDQKYPERPLGRSIGTIDELAELAAPAKSSHIVYLKCWPEATRAGSQLSRLATRGSRPETSTTSPSSCCSRCCARRRLFAGRRRAPSTSTCSCSAGLSSSCCTSCCTSAGTSSRLSTISASSPGSLTQEYLRRHRPVARAARRRHRLRRIQRQIRRTNRHRLRGRPRAAPRSGSHGERMRHGWSRRSGQPVLGRCGECELERILAKHSAKYQVNAERASGTFIGRKHANLAEPARPLGSPRYRPLLSDDLSEQPRPSHKHESPSQIDVRPRPSRARATGIRPARTGNVERVINNLPDLHKAARSQRRQRAERLNIATQADGSARLPPGSPAAAASRARDKVEPGTHGANYRRHAYESRSPSAERQLRGRAAINGCRRHASRRRSSRRACHHRHRHSRSSSGSTRSPSWSLASLYRLYYSRPRLGMNRHKHHHCSSRRERSARRAELHYLAKTSGRKGHNQRLSSSGRQKKQPESNLWLFKGLQLDNMNDLDSARRPARRSGRRAEQQAADRMLASARPKKHVSRTTISRLAAKSFKRHTSSLSASSSIVRPRSSRLLARPSYSSKTPLGKPATVNRLRSMQRALLVSNALWPEANGLTRRKLESADDQQIMNRFLVKTLTPRPGADQDLISDPTRQNGAKALGWQFVPRCQCSHCCLVEQFIIRDTEAKIERRLARKAQALFGTGN